MLVLACILGEGKALTASELFIINMLVKDVSSSVMGPVYETRI
jgi:hypothetical protein